MKDGMTINQLAQAVTEADASKRDYVVPARHLRLDNDGFLTFPEGKGDDAQTLKFVPAKRATQQLAAWAGVPTEYFDRMVEKGFGDLAADNVNRWLGERVVGEGRLVRTLHGRARAILSPRYSTQLDNIHLATAVMPVLSEFGSDLTIGSVNVSDDYLHLKVTSKKLTRDVKVGDPVEFGVSIRNSEVGMSSWLIEPFIMRLRCINGMVVADRTMRKRHVGSDLLGDADDVSSVLSDKAIEADGRAVILKTRDVFRAALNDVAMADRLTEQMATTTGRVINVGNPVDFVEAVRKQARLNEDEGSKVLQHLLAGGDLTQWGLANAITRAAADVESYDRATQLERLGGDVMMLDRNAWDKVTEKGVLSAAA